MLDMTWFNDLSASEQQELLEGPAMKPPQGITSDFTNTSNQNTMGFTVILVASILITLLVICQLYTRLKHQKKFYPEDYMAVIALAAFATYNYFVWNIILDPGLLVHQWNMKLKQLPHLIHSIRAGSTTHGTVIMILKVGILLQWLRIFVPRGVRDAFYYTCHITMWINIIFYTICTFVGIFSCSPREKMWKPWVAGKCLEADRIIIAGAFINFLSDLIILILPQSKIWRLNMSLAHKICTASLFAVGIFATACAGVRIKLGFDYKQTKDTAYVIAQIGIWALAEVVAGFFILCSPTLPRLIRGSSWIQQVVLTLSRFTGHTFMAEEAPRNVRSWPRSKPRRDPDESLLAETSDVALVPLTEVYVSAGQDSAKMQDEKYQIPITSTFSPTYPTKR